MVFVSAAVAVFGMQAAADYVERQSGTAPAGPGGPTTIEVGEPPFVGSDAESPESDSQTPTTVFGTAASSQIDSGSGSESRSGVGAAASSSVPESTGDKSDNEPAGDGPQQRGQLALQQIGFDWEAKLPGWNVTFHEERDGLFGLTLVEEKQIEIYVRDDQSDDLLVHIVAHEIGHAVDVTLNSGRDRREWQAARGIEDEPWWPSSAASDFQTGAGDFAESFAYWQAESDNYRSKLGPEPNAAQLELMARLASG